MSTDPAVECVLWGFPEVPSRRPLCSVYTSLTSPLATDTEPAAPTAICQPPCGNGGSCIRPGHCRCPVGWQGDTCQTDVDECSTGEASCPQRCVNTVGSYWCQGWEGQSPSADGTRCLSKEGPSPVAPNPTAGVDSMAREEVYRLQARVDVLEQVRLGWEWILLVSHTGLRKACGHCHSCGGRAWRCKVSGCQSQALPKHTAN